MTAYLYRGYGHDNDEIIEKSVTFAKQVVLDYYDSIADYHAPAMRQFIDKDRAKVHKVMNDSLAFFRDKNNIGTGLDRETWYSINDTIMSSVYLYHTYLIEHSGDLKSDELETELAGLEKILDHNEPNPDSDYKKYIKLYDELVNILKLYDIKPEDEEEENLEQ
jgi:hypothetical protein